MNENETKMAEHFERVIDNLNQHWHSIQLLLSYVSKPLTVDDRGLREAYGKITEKLKETEKVIDSIIEKIEVLDISHTFGEIKYIGKRLTAIEERIDSIKEEGLKKKIELHLFCEGYELQKKEYIDDTRDKKEILNELLNTLIHRESVVIQHRLALNGGKKKTLEEIGKIVGVSKERVRQIYLKGLRKLRHPSRRNLVNKIIHKELKEAILGEDS